MGGQEKERKKRGGPTRDKLKAREERGEKKAKAITESRQQCFHVDVRCNFTG